MLQIQFSIRSGSNFIPIEIIIIQTHENGLLAMDPQLGCQTIGGSGFAGRTGSCQHNGLCTPLTDHICHLRIPLLVQGLIDPDQFPELSRGGQIIQVRNRLTLHECAPALALIEDGEEIRHGRTLGKDIRVFLIRVNKQKTTVSRHNIPHRQVARRGRHLAVIVIGKVFIGILVKIVPGTPGEQSGFILLAVSTVAMDGLFQRYSAADQRNILLDQFQHPLFQFRHRKVFCANHLNIDTGTQRAVHFCPDARPQLAKGQENHKLSSPNIAFSAGRIAAAQQLHFSVGGCHGTAHGRTFRIQILLPQRNVVQGKDFTGNFRCNGTVRKSWAVHSGLTNQIKKTLSRLQRYLTMIQF